jgi:protease IV
MAKAADFFKNIFFLVLFLQFAPILFENIRKQYKRYLEPHTYVGCVPIKGVILQSSSYTRQLKKLFEDKSVKAILLSIESPGGAAGAAESIAHEIELLKKEYPKPIITISENVVASGGYYIAAATDYIIVAPSTLVGSIGVLIPGQFKLHDFIEDYKIHYNVIQAGDYKSATDPFAPTTPEQKLLLKTVVDSSYKNFIEHVSAHRRKLEIKNAHEWADGKIFPGKLALTLGLVDLIGSQSNAIQKIKEMAIIEGTIEWIKPAKTTSLWSLFFGSSDAQDENDSCMSKMITNACITLEERYGLIPRLNTQMS